MKRARAGENSAASGCKNRFSRENDSERRGRDRQVRKESARERPVRNEKSVQGVFYANGKAGPSDVNSPSWSPDGVQVVYRRYTGEDRPEPKITMEPKSEVELFGTALLPACDPTRERFAVTTSNETALTMSLFVVEQGKPTHSILEKQDLILGPQ